MLENYFKVALRNLSRHRGYAALNVVGLAVGIACCLVILLFVRDELRHDRFHAKADRIFRLAFGTNEDGQPTNANSNFPIGPALEADLAEVRRAVRLAKVGWGEERVFARGERRFYEDAFFFADPGVLDVFTFPLVRGDPRTALAGPRRLVLTASTARKYFGEEDALGETIAVDPFNDGRFTEYTVAGVMEDVPAASHVQFDFLLSLASIETLPPGWGLEAVFTYVELAEGADVDAVRARLPAFLARHVGEEAWYDLHLQPITDIHLRSHLRAELEPNGDVAYVYLFTAIALFILLLACINYMNMATARSARRAKEVGLRKVVGARRGQLVGQFLAEAALSSLLAGLLALPLVELMLPVFNGISGKELALDYAADAGLLAALGGLMLLVGTVAGSYPALYLSGFQPAGVLRGGAAARRAAVLRRGLVVFQFAVSILLLACTAVVSEQMDHIRSRNVGFERDQIVVLPLNDRIRERYGAFREAVLREPAIRGVTLSEQVPARAGNGSSYLLQGEDDDVSASRLFTDVHFLDAYGIELVAGRGFSEAQPTDAAEAFVVNETFVRRSGWERPEEAVGRAMTMFWGDVGREGRIVGVVRDFQLDSFREAMWPVVINPMPLEAMNFVSARLTPGPPGPALEHLEETWAVLAPEYPFEYYFLDADFERLHRADIRLGQVFRAFAVLALLVAGLGLFGLAAFTAEQRTKEIGIRKVLGASSASIVVLLSKDFTRLVLVAFVVAAPAAYLGMSRWLESFVYRVDVGAAPLLAAGALALAVAWLTVSYQAVRVALTDPADSLRYE